MIGNYRLVAPPEFTVTQLPTGAVQLQRPNVTAHLASRSASKVAAAEQLRPLMEAWNPDQPLSALGPISTEAHAKAGGTLASQRYEQKTEDGRLLHGVFTVQVAPGPTPEALILDVFATGPAKGAQDWPGLNDTAARILKKITLRRPW